MNVEVNSCSDCPLCNNDMEKGISCNYPGNKVEDYQMPPYNEEWIPANCPLIQADIHIKKAIGATIKIKSE